MNLLRNLSDSFLGLVGRRILNIHQVPRRLDAAEWSTRHDAAHYCASLYANLLPTASTAQALHAHEIKVYSQHGEDGILLHLLSRIGVTNRVFVEFGVEDGTECNAANLAIHFGFRGLLMDGDDKNVARGRSFYASLLRTEASRVDFRKAWITKENINDLIRDAGIQGEIDLFSLDLDGNDYWVWEALTVIQPRIVVAEYNAAFGPTAAVSIPYDAAFNRWEHHPSGYYFGASLTALTRLAETRGYVLIGCESSGNNAFYVRQEIAENVGLTPLAPEQAFIPMRDRVARGHTTEQQSKMIAHLPQTAV